MKISFKALALLPLFVATCVAFAQSASDTLFTAARTNNVALAQSLLAGKPNINQQDDKGYTPLILATYNDNYEVAQVLLAHHASTETKDRSGRTALMGASFKGYDREVQLLLDNGANAAAKDGTGLTSMAYAVMFARLSVIKVLRAHDASLTTHPGASPAGN